MEAINPHSIIGWRYWETADDIGSEEEDILCPVKDRDEVPDQDDEDNVLVEELNNLLVMEVKLLRIDELSKVWRDLVNDPNFKDHDVLLIILIKVTNL